jgi:ABC-2 type transport system permease protein
MSGGRTASVVLGVAWRNLYTTLKTPSLAVPPVMIPLFTLAVFAGGLSSVRRVPNFDFNGDYTAFAFIFILVQSSAMCGMFSAVALARDFESRFARRLMLAAPHRWQILAGYALSAIARAAVTIPILLVAGLLFGMEVNGSPLQLLGLFGLSLLIAIVAALWAMGVALRKRSAQAQPIMMLPIFTLLFAAPTFMPVPAMQGWLHDVASWNPLTPFMEAGRGLISGEPEAIAKALAVAGAMAVLFAIWTVTGLRKAEAAGG